MAQEEMAEGCWKGRESSPGLRTGATTKSPRWHRQGSSRRCGDQPDPPFPHLPVQHPSVRMTLPLPKLAAFFLLPPPSLFLAE